METQTAESKRPSDISIFKWNVDAVFSWVFQWASTKYKQKRSYKNTKTTYNPYSLSIVITFWYANICILPDQFSTYQNYLKLHVLTVCHYNITWWSNLKTVTITSWNCIQQNTSCILISTIDRCYLFNVIWNIDSKYVSFKLVLHMESLFIHSSSVDISVHYMYRCNEFVTAW